MAVRTREEIINTVNTIVGDEPDDTGIGLLEDLADTLDDYETRINDKTNWKEKYETNDKNWRDKYRKRFGQGSNEPPDITEPKQYQYRDLFKIGG